MSSHLRLTGVLRARLLKLQVEHDELQTSVVVAHCIDRIMADGDGGEKGMDTSIAGGVTFQSVPTDLSGLAAWDRDGSVFRPFVRNCNSSTTGV